MLLPSSSRQSNIRCRPNPLRPSSVTSPPTSRYDTFATPARTRRSEPLETLTGPQSRGASFRYRRLKLASALIWASVRCSTSDNLSSSKFLNRLRPFRLAIVTSEGLRVIV